MHPIFWRRLALWAVIFLVSSVVFFYVFMQMDFKMTLFMGVLILHGLVLMVGGAFWFFLFLLPSWFSPCVPVHGTRGHIRDMETHDLYDKMKNILVQEY